MLCLVLLPRLSWRKGGLPLSAARSRLSKVRAPFLLPDPPARMKVAVGSGSSPALCSELP